MSAPAPSPGPAQRSRRRLWLFRVAAVVLGLSVFALAELVCWIFDWGRPTDYDDPSVGFSAVHPLFVKDETGARYEIAPSRRLWFSDESFPVEKGPATYRVFVLGESTVQGQPFEKETSFTTWLELALKEADGERDWEVVNCGGVSYASYRLAPILKECLAYQPDLFIICVGHNEFLEERTYEHVKHAPGLLAVPQRLAARSRVYTLLRQAALCATGQSPSTGPRGRPVLSETVDPLLDHGGGLEAYRRDDEWRARVIEHYGFNLRRMMALAGDAGLPVILVRPCSNLRDCPPFKSQHRGGLSAGELDRWRKLMAEARECYRTDLERAAALLGEALRIDDRHALTWYELAKCRDAQRRFPEAREAYLRARDEDVCPLRMLTDMETVLADVARETGTPLVDAHVLLEEQSPDGILGLSLLVDHVHPSFTGHQMIAAALLEEMARQEIADPRADWRAAAEASWQRHFESLDDLYFLRGERTLERLHAWTQGRGELPPIRPDVPGPSQNETPSR